MEFFEFVQWAWKPVIEIGVFWFVFYLIFVYIQDSGMVQALKGIVFIVLFFVLAQVLELKSIRWILSHLFQISIIGFLIIFQQELRRGLTRIGQSPLFKFFIKEEKTTDEVIRAVVSMSKNRIGALIAIERGASLKTYSETGIALDGILTTELLITIFMPNTPFHDGGVIIQGGRVMAVGCLFPLSQSQKLAKTMGTRHRAALGLSEETDALVVVVSEETGIISLMSEGKLHHNIDEAKLKHYLFEAHQSAKTAKTKRFGFLKEAV
jgi:diadenylate cyclase